MPDTIGQRVRARRKFIGYKQGDLLERLRQAGHAIVPEHLSRIENGHHQPGAALLPALAEALDTTVAYLIGETDDPARGTAPEIPVPTVDMADLVARLNRLSPDVRNVIMRLVETALELNPILSQEEHRRLFGPLPSEVQNRLISELETQVEEQPTEGAPAPTRARGRPVVRGSTGKTTRKRTGTGPR